MQKHVQPMCRHARLTDGTEFRDVEVTKRTPTYWNVICEGEEYVILKYAISEVVNYEYSVN